MRSALGSLIYALVQKIWAEEGGLGNALNKTHQNSEGKRKRRNIYKKKKDSTSENQICHVFVTVWERGGFKTKNGCLISLSTSPKWKQNSL